MDSRSNILIKTPKTEAFRVLFSPQTEIYALSTDKTAIILCDSGKISVEIFGISYSLSQTDIIVCPVGKCNIHNKNSENSCVILLLLSDYQYAGCAKNELPYSQNETVIFSSSSSAPLCDTIRLISKEAENMQFGYQKTISGLLDYLLILIERNINLCEPNPEDRQEQTGDFIYKIKEYIEHNYEQNITLNSLSEVFFVSSFHIAHIFKEKFDISPIQFLMQTRIKSACNLLIDTNHTINDISFMVGYPNPNYFHMIFKRFTGYSPGKYRKLNKQK